MGEPRMKLTADMNISIAGTPNPIFHPRFSWMYTITLRAITVDNAIEV